MPDIFISFAHVDNQPVSGQEKGWISIFVNNLRNEVSRKMGRAEDYQLWMDFCLKGSDELTPEIERQLGETHILIILLSRAWLSSEWCPRELEIFIRGLKHAAGRIFVIELDRISSEEKPIILRDLVTYRFWKMTDQDKVRQLGYPIPLASETAYYDGLVDLSRDLADAIKSNKMSASVRTVKARVYVAPVFDSLYEQRARVISELRQYGIDTLPHNNAFDADQDAALEKCSHFIQLLDHNCAMGIPFEQHLKAEAIGKPILQWRDPNLDYKNTCTLLNNESEKQKKLLENNTVIAAPLIDFIRMIREAVLPKPTPIEETEQTRQCMIDQMIFVHAGQDDFECAYKVAQKLRSQGYGIALPKYKGDASYIRKSIERGYQTCDVLLMVHKQTSADVVEDFLFEASVQRETRSLILICRCTDAEELSFFPPGTMTLECKNDFEEHCLQQFLAEVQK